MRVLDVLRSVGVGLLGIGTAVALMAGMLYVLRLGLLRMVLGMPAICGLAAGYLVGLADQRHPVLTAAVAGAVGLGAILATPDHDCFPGQLRRIAIGMVVVAACAGVLGAVWAARTAHPWWGAGAILGAIVLPFAIPHIMRITRVRSFTSERLGDVRAAVAQMLVGIPATDVSWRHDTVLSPSSGVEMRVQWTGETGIAGKGACDVSIKTERMPRTGPLEGVVRSITFEFQPESPAAIRSQEEALSLLNQLAVIPPRRPLEWKRSEIVGIVHWWSTGWVDNALIGVYDDGRAYASYYWHPPAESDEDLDDPFDFSDESFGSALRKLWRWCARLW